VGKSGAQRGEVGRLVGMDWAGLVRLVGNGLAGPDENGREMVGGVGMELARRE